MEKQNAEPQATPTFSVSDDPTMPALMEHLSLSDKAASNTDTVEAQKNSKVAFSQDKTKKI